MNTEVGGSNGIVVSFWSNKLNLLVRISARLTSIPAVYFNTATPLEKSTDIGLTTGCALQLVTIKVCVVAWIDEVVGQRLVHNLYVESKWKINEPRSMCVTSNCSSFSKAALSLLLKKLQERSIVPEPMHKHNRTLPQKSCICKQRFCHGNVELEWLVLCSILFEGLVMMIMLTHYVL